MQKYEPMKKEINQIMLTHCQSSRDIINVAVNDLIGAGGKRLRPLLLVLAAKFGNFQKDKILKIAAGMELLHTATLVHDDIVDEAHLRRGEETTRSRFGNKTAIFVGDYLLTKAYQLMAQNLSRHSLERLNKIVRLICEGEVDQYSNKYNYDLSIIDYFRRIRRKTALLFGACTYIGAYEADLREKELFLLYKYGMEMGMAFQIQDDLLDFVGKEEKVGKEIGQDIKAGIYTLPLLLLMTDERYSKRIKNMLRKKDNMTDTDLKEINNMVVKANTIEKTKKIANKFLDKARGKLNQLPVCQEKKDLEYIIEWQLQREK